MRLALLIALLLPVLAFADDSRISMEAVEVLFSPRGNIEAKVVAEIDNARSQVLVEAYTITSKPIRAALVRAETRGATLIILLDGAYGVKSSGKLLELDPFVWVDGFEDKHGGIAHSKVMIIDQSTVIWGSYNWTGKAETVNHEVCSIVRKASPTFVRAFVTDFEKHKGHSVGVTADSTVKP